MASSSSAGLFKDREKFIKRQAEENAFLAAAEKRQKVDKPASQKANRPKPSMARAKTSSDLTSDYPSSGVGHKNRLQVMAKIVDKLQERFLGGQTESATLDEIIEEAAISVDSSDKHWLASSALLTNPKIDVETVNDVNRFVYKPPLDLKVPKKAALLNLLKRRHEKCEGAVTVEDIQDTLPKAKAQLIIDSLIKSKDAIKFTSNKRDVLFYTDREYDLQVNQEFIEAWRKASVEGMDEKMLTEYLLNQGHNALRKNTSRPTAMPTKAKRAGRRVDTMKHNQHVADQLEDYSNQAGKK